MSPATLVPLIFPAGNVMTDRPGPGIVPYGFPWANVARWEPWFSEAALDSEVPAQLIAAMAIVESNANHTWPSGPNQGQVIEVWDNSPQDGPSVGIMQVKPWLWQAILPDADAYTAHGSIRLGARLVRNFITNRGSWQEAIKRDYHPGIAPNGTTPEMYVAAVASLMAEMGLDDGPVFCVPSAPPPYDGTQKTINDVVFHPDRRTVSSKIEGLQARRYATTEACLTREPLHDGDVAGVLYWIRGESVSGEDRWWVADDGSRIWTGGTHEQPTVG